MGPGQDSAESSLWLATAPWADRDFTHWLPSQWTALSERPFCDLSWEHFIHAGWSSCPFRSKLTLLSPKQPQRIWMRQRRGRTLHNPSMFPGELSLLSRIPRESCPTTEAMAWRESRARLPWRSLPICSHPSQELNLPMERKPDTCLPAASESDPAFFCFQ